MIVDFHLHLLDEPAFIEDHLRKMDDADVQYSLLHALPPFTFVGHPCSGNDDVLGAVESHPDRFLGSVYLDPREKEWRLMLEKYLDAGFRCVKMFPPVGFYPDDDRFEPVFDLLNQMKMPVLMHAGVTNFPGTDSKFADPLRLDGLLRKYPDIRFILAHWGGLGTFPLAWALMKANSNIYLDASGRRWCWPGVALYHVYEPVTPLDFNRVLWGTDNLVDPKQDMADNLSILHEIGKEGYKDRFFGETARMILGL